MFHLFHLFHRVLMSERYLHVPLVLPVPPAVNIWERVACSTCSTICFTWSICSTVCLCLGEIRLFYLFHQFHWLSLSGIFSHVPLVPPIPPVAPVPPGVYIWESFIFSTCLTCYTCSPGCLCLGKICLIHLFRLFHWVSMSGRDTHVPLVLPFSLVPCVYVWERFPFFTCSTCSTGCLCLVEIRIFHFFYLFHRGFKSGRDSLVSLVPPIRRGVYVCDRFTCSTCSTWSTGCLYLGEICMLHLFCRVSISHIPLALFGI